MRMTVTEIACLLPQVFIVPDAEPSRSVLAPVVWPCLGAPRMQDQEGPTTGRDRVRSEPLVYGRILRTGRPPQVLYHM
jgi:hypothetical protein